MKKSAGHVKDYAEHSNFPDVGQDFETTTSFLLDFSGLQCALGDGFEFFVLYVNDIRIMSFNTICHFIAPSFTSRIFVTGLLNDPVNDDIHAVVRRESHLDDPEEGPIVLEGWLE